jgi:hypothetical protein
MSTVLAILLWPPSIPRLLDIILNETTMMGVVTSTDCGNHNIVNYSFEVNGQSFKGAETTSDLCGHTVAGSPIMIHYSARYPKHNVASDPVGRLWNSIIPFLLACLLFPPLMAWSLERRSRRKREADAHSDKERHD